jgi:RNA 3'-terminal phosphate cyclase (ATP)
VADLIEIDGSMGEGGGQVLRTSLALSLLTQTPIRIRNIRAGRSRPGLRAQHVTCVQAAARVGAAEVEGATLGSGELRFRPQALLPLDLELDLGTAGSTALVAQTILPALLRASGPSRIRLRGGTHNPLAPSYEFLERVYFPWLTRLGTQPRAELIRPGFFPKGGGRVDYRVQPATKLSPFELSERGALKSIRAEVYLSSLPEAVAERELAEVRAALELRPEDCRVIRPARPKGPGNALLITVESEHAIEVVTAYGQKGKRAERVASEAVAETQRYLKAEVPVGEHGADQLLLLFAIAGGGSFVSLPPSGHTATQCELIPRYLPQIRIESEELDSERWRYRVTRS